MTERPKVRDWKSRVPGRVPRVRIPPSPHGYGRCTARLGNRPFRIIFSYQRKYDSRDRATWGGELRQARKGATVAMLPRVSGTPAVTFSLPRKHPT